MESNITPIVPEGMNKILVTVLSSPGPIVSFSQLLKNGLFRRHTVDNVSNKRLLLRAVEELSLLHFGHVESFTIPTNNTKVYFLCKRQPTEDQDDALTFATHLAAIGMSLPTYVRAYESQDNESAKHKEDYDTRQLTETASPRKKQRVIEPEH